MLVTKTHYDIPTKLDANGRPIRIFVISPVVRGYPNAKFPGTHVEGEVVCIYSNPWSMQALCASGNANTQDRRTSYLDTSQRNLPSDWAR